MLGFSGAPGIQQNAALLDHRSAVEWIRDIIEGFGGDPRRIVIVGQSAGGSSVDYWSFAWKNDPIVSGLVAHSGTSLSFNPNTPEYAQKLWFNVTETIGCGGPNDDTAAVLACARATDIETLLAAAGKVPPLPTIALNQATFHPTIDNITVFGNYDDMTKQGKLARIPTLAGNANSEAGWYKLSAYAAKVNLTEDQWDLFNQRAFTCPTKYHGDWDNLRLYNGSAGLGPRGSGAYHGSDVSMLFGTAEDVSGLRNTPAQEATIEYMQRACATFARDPVDGLESIGWPRYRENAPTLAQLAFENDPEPEFVKPSIHDAPSPAENDPLPGQGAF